MVPGGTMANGCEFGEGALRAEHPIGNGQKSNPGLTSEYYVVGGEEDKGRFVREGAPPAEPVGGT